MRITLRKALAATLVLSLSLIATGCNRDKENTDTSSQISETVESVSLSLSDDTQNTEPDEENDSSSKTDDVKFDVSVYDEILEYTYRVLAGIDSRDSLSGTPGTNWVYDLMYIENVYERLDSVGYMYKDVTGDNIPELLIAGAFNEYSHGSNIYDIFTVKDGKPTLIDEGWARSSIYLTDDGAIYTEGSAGAANSCVGKYYLKSDGTKEWIDFFFTEGDPNNDYALLQYHNKTGEWNTEASELLNDSDPDYLENFESLSDNLVFLESTLFTTLSDRYGEPVNCVLYVYEDEGFSNGVDRYDTMDDPNSVDVHFVPMGTKVFDFKFLGLSLTDVDENGNVTYESTPILELGDIDDFSPFIIEAAFPGTLPSYGFSYLDEFGTLHEFALIQSGKDGTIALMTLQ